MPGSLVVHEINVAEVVFATALLAVACGILLRGGGARWARWGAGGFALLVVSRIGTSLAQLWLHRKVALREPLQQWIGTYHWMETGAGLLWLAGLAALAISILSQRGRPDARRHSESAQAAHGR